MLRSAVAADIIGASVTLISAHPYEVKRRCEQDSTDSDSYMDCESAPKSLSPQPGPSHIYKYPAASRAHPGRHTKAGVSLKVKRRCEQDSTDSDSYMDCESAPKSLSPQPGPSHIYKYPVASRAHPERHTKAGVSLKVKRLCEQDSTDSDSDMDCESAPKSLLPQPGPSHIYKYPAASRAHPERHTKASISLKVKRLCEQDSTDSDSDMDCESAPKSLSPQPGPSHIYKYPAASRVHPYRTQKGKGSRYTKAGVSLKNMLLHLILLVFMMENASCMNAEVVVLRAVRGRDARLPCGQGKVFLDGPDSYVLWLKNDRDFLYRFPNEETETRAANRDRIFGTSCESGTCHDDTSLLIKKVTDSDGGMYLCRVHYQASPSVDYVVDIRLVDSPGVPKLYDGNHNEINKGYVGPLSLGSDLTLICEVEDQQPDTLVYWRRNDVVIDRSYNSRPGTQRVEVRLANLTRSELDAHYECLAQNADVSDPLIASVVVKMFLPPLSVEIRLNNNYDFEAGQPRVVDCVVVGCVPPPSITWHLGDTMLRPTVHKELHDGNYTVSSLTLAPSLRDNRHELVCRAHNSYLPSELFEDKVTLNVGYRPICQTNGDERIGAVLREAETVTCIVDALPEPLQFSWTFADSKTLYTSVTKVPGHHHRYSSTLTWLSREGDIGMLLCRATNSFGEQKKPCSYTISSGGPPATPDCEILRAYPSALRVQCKKGWDGGRPQTVHLEILDEEGTPIQNVSDPAGHFYLPTVMDDRNLTAVLYASNARGKSDTTSIYLETLKSLTPSAVTEYVSRPWVPYLEAVVVALALAFTVVSITLGGKLIIARIDNAALNPDLVPSSDGTFHREPDFARDERLVGTTNITVNQLPACQNQYSSSPLPGCRVMVGCGSPSDTCPSTPHSYYV